MFAWEPDLMFAIAYRGMVPRTMWRWNTPAATRVSQLLNQAQWSQSEIERRRLFGQVQDILSEEVPQWPIHRRRQPTAWRDTLASFAPLPTPGLDLSRPAGSFWCGGDGRR